VLQSAASSISYGLLTCLRSLMEWTYIGKDEISSLFSGNRDHNEISSYEIKYTYCVQRLRVCVTYLACFHQGLTLSPCSLYVRCSNNHYETWYVYHGTRALFNSVVHQCIPSICVSVHALLLLLVGKGFRC
jgi:hypothetical protein